MVSVMENFEEILMQEGSGEELNKLKSWLFRENVRLITAQKELEQIREQFECCTYWMQGAQGKTPI